MPQDDLAYIQQEAENTYTDLVREVIDRTDMDRCIVGRLSVDTMYRIVSELDETEDQPAEIDGYQPVGTITGNVWDTQYDLESLPF